MKISEVLNICDIVYRTYLKNNLNAHGGVAKRFKMLTYYVCAPLSHRFAPPILGISQSSTCFLLNPKLIFEIGSSISSYVIKITG